MTVSNSAAPSTAKQGGDTYDVRSSVRSDDNCLPYLRFLGVNVPRGGISTTATLELYNTNNGGFDDLRTTLYGDDADNSRAFDDTYDVSYRSKTTANQYFSADNISIGWKSYDVTSIVQEIVNRPGRSSSNALSILMIPDAYVATEYRARYDDLNNATGNEAKLTVNYSGTNTLLARHFRG